ncbi:MAG: glycosyltransferase family 4 protein [Candidatus Electrothrix sp. AR4]|nr:glycosyltransferase family 4 protein [Candidatus Electrothrix sp. AR4]
MTTRLGKILCVTSNLPRWQGDSTTPFVLHLAQDLQELGWHVDILAPHAPNAAEQEILNGVHIERFRYLWPKSSQTVCYQGGALINLRKNPLNKVKLPALVGAELAAVTKRVLARDYDIIHSHWLLPQGFTGMLAQKLKPIPHVVTVHGGDVFGLRGQILSIAKRAVLNTASAVTVNSSVTENEVMQLTPNLDTVHRIPMGVSTQLPNSGYKQLTESIRQRYCKGKGPLVLFVGRLVEEKGVEDFLRAIVIVRKQFPEVRALIAGAGQDRTYFERLSISLKLDDCVKFSGWVTPEEIPAYYLAADIFVGPSRRAENGWVEAQGLTFLEAMTSGIPVIATRLGGVVDSVLHEETGLLVDERSPQQIADALHRLLSDKNLRQQISRNGRKMVDSQFSRQASAETFSSLFKELCQQSKIN